MIGLLFVAASYSAKVLLFIASIGNCFIESFRPNGSTY